MRATGLVVLLVVGVVMVAGCGRKETVYTPGGKVTVDRQNGGKSVQVQTDKGIATADTAKKTITEAELGAPVYPGATVEVSSTYAGTTTAHPESMQHNMLTTPDSFDKVVAFYKTSLKHVENTVNQSAGGTQMAMFSAKTDDGSSLAVNITTDTEKKVTRIQVVKAKAGKP